MTNPICLGDGAGNYVYVDRDGTHVRDSAGNYVHVTRNGKVKTSRNGGSSTFTGGKKTRAAVPMIGAAASRRNDGANASDPVDIERGGIKGAFADGHIDYNLWKTTQEMDYTVWKSQMENDYLDSGAARKKKHGSDLILLKRALESDYSALQSKQELSYALWLQEQTKGSKDDFGTWKSRQGLDYGDWKSRHEAEYAQWKMQTRQGKGISITLCNVNGSGCCCCILMVLLIWLLIHALQHDHVNEN